MRKSPKYTYRQKVIVTNGFFKDMVGLVEYHRNEGIFFKNSLYTVEFPDGATSYIYEEDLDILPVEQFNKEFEEKLK